MIYLDYAATTPMSDYALSVYTEVAKKMFGNSNSLHDVGGQAKHILEECRNHLAGYINGEAKGIYFTSGGTESNILGVQSLIEANSHKGNHLITTATEHSSLYNLFQLLESKGFNVTYLSVDKFGQIRLDELEKAITPKTILASIQHANSEIGTVQPIKEIGYILKKYNVIFHCDCVQTFGKIPIDVQSACIDSLSISSHKIYGPKGVGAVYIRPFVKWKSFIPNTTHESGFRPGTVNVPGIAAFLAATEEQMGIMNAEYQRYVNLRNSFLEELKNISPIITVEGHPYSNLPHIVGMTLKGIEGQYTMLELNRRGIAVSTGSACQVGMQNPSKTMIAIGKKPEEAKHFIRISFGKFTTINDLKQVVKSIQEIVQDSFETKEGDFFES
jgi:cysteine desulfurase